jgi:hypothetical protein
MVIGAGIMAVEPLNMGILLLEVVWPVGTKSAA